jgi:hypothetical protein
MKTDSLEENEVSLYELVEKVDTAILDWGTDYANWYCGAASNPQQRLFGDHGVNQSAGYWIIVDVGSELAAYRLKALFMQKGCKGAPAARDEKARFFYAYLMMPSTRQ